MDTANLFAANSLVWPLTFLVVALYVFKRLQTDLSPVVTSMVSSLAQQVAKHSLLFAVAIMFGLSSSLTAFYEVFQTIDDATAKSLSIYQFLALAAKCANPFIGGFLGYALGKGVMDAKPVTQDGRTNPPHP